MAYRKSIRQECYCGKLAHYEVFNEHNASIGYYCNSCSKSKVKEMNESR